MNRLNKEASVVEEINGVRCAIVEKNAPPDRVEFLKKLLEHNGYVVMVAQTPAPAAKPTPKPIASAHPSPEGAVKVSPGGGDLEGAPPPPLPPPPPPPVAPNTFSIGVTNISFHAMLAVYERSFFTPEGKIVSIAYWNQEPEMEVELYWERRTK